MPLASGPWPSGLREAGVGSALVLIIIFSVIALRRDERQPPPGPDIIDTMSRWA
jgi:hypothetical protein